MKAFKSNKYLRGAGLLLRHTREAVSTALEENRFCEIVYNNRFLNARVHRREIDDAAPYPVLLSGGGGLFYLEGRSLTQILRVDGYAYIFGISSCNGNLYLSYNYHLGVKRASQNPDANRMTAIIRVPMSQIRAVIGQRTDCTEYVVEISRKGENFSYVNIFESEVVAASYLGHIYRFPIKQDGSLAVDRERRMSIARAISGENLFYYPFFHLNCVSLDAGKIYVGAHMYTKMTKDHSRLYEFNDETSAPKLSRMTSFVSGHDMMMSRGEFYGCDSGNGAFYRGDECLYRGEGFARGLSISERGFVVGMNASHKNRADRLKGGWCTLAFIRPHGGLDKLVRVPIPTVYNVKAVGVPDYTQTTVDPIEVS